MEEEIRALLLSDAVVAGIVGGDVNFGAHPQGRPLPGVVLNTVSAFDDYTLEGASGLSEARVQVDCYALTYGASKSLSLAVKAVLGGYSGGKLQGVFKVAGRDTREGSASDANAVDRPFRVSMDFQVIFSG